MTKFITLSAATALLSGYHDDATAENISAVVAVCNATFSCYADKRTQDSIRAAVIETQTSGNNCVGADDYNNAFILASTLDGWYDSVRAAA